MIEILKQFEAISRRRKIFLFLMLLWMVVIFIFSARDSDHSSMDSAWVSKIIGTLFIRDFRTWTAEQQAAFMESISFFVRKAAHATEYAILAMLACGTVGWSRRPKHYVTSWLIAVCYAATDEFHQSFTPGRSPQVQDVLIDSCGALIGILIVLSMSLILRKLRSVHKK